jgi:hypothetical protein
MFTRYITPDAFGEVPRSEKPPEPQPYEDVSNQSGSADKKPSGTAKGLFGSGIKLPEFDADTILMLVLVYFLISDELSPSSKDDGDSEKNKNKISDTLLIIGALLLLGF